MNCLSGNFVLIIMILINYYLNYIWCLPSSASSRSSTTSLDNQQKLLIILLDGFAANYLTMPALDGFEYIKRNGVHAKYMVPQFPTISYPNFYSILTGLYVENHHITFNTMYDETDGTTFDSSPKWWDKAETMWISMTKAGLRTRIYLWPGCEVPIDGIRPDYCLKNSFHVWTSQFQWHLNDVAKSFVNDRADIGFVYCEQPDLFGHIFGPKSALVNITVHSLDNILQRFLEDMVEKDLHDKVNIIVVSDHGMISVGSNAARKISLANYININDVEVILDRGAVAGIFPLEGKLESVYKQLKRMPGMSVWKKEDIPDHYHFKFATTAPPILLLAHRGYYIKGVPRTRKQLPNIPIIGIRVVDLILQGFHGYDPDEVTDMRGIFLAIGPAFKKGFTLEPIFNKDVYNLAMKIVGVPAKPNDGNWTAIAPALRILT